MFGEGEEGGNLNTYCYFAPKKIFARYQAKFVGSKTRGDYLARKASIKLANKGKRGGRREAKKKARKLQDAKKLTRKAKNEQKMP